MKITSLVLVATFGIASCSQDRTSSGGREHEEQRDNDFATNDENGLTDPPLTELQEQMPTHAVGLISSFGFRPSSKIAAYVGFYSGDRYISGVIQLVNKNMFKMMASAGHYSQRGGRIVTKPEKITCPVIKPGGTILGTDQDDSITVTVGSTTTVLRKFESTELPAAGLVIKWGCFDQKTGEFSEHPWIDLAE